MAEPATGKREADASDPKSENAGETPLANDGGEEASASDGDRRRLRDSMGGNVLVIAIATLIVLAGAWVVGNVLRSDPEPATSASAAPSAGGYSEVTLDAEASGAAPAVGEMAPGFTILSTTGEEVALSESRGKPVWLVFGATWCQNCRSEAPDVEAAHQTLGDAAEVVVIYVGESLDTVAAYGDRLGLTATQIADAYSEIGSLYRVMALPTHVFIAPDGTVAEIVVGTLTEQAAVAKLQGLAEG